MMLVQLENLQETETLARVLAEDARVGDIFALSGDLGAGKTAFARAFIHARAKAAERMDLVDEVPSPTFTLVQEYDLPNGRVSHFDLYRLKDPDDAIELGIEDAFADSICLIEWPDRLAGLLSDAPHSVALMITEGERRQALLSGGRWSTSPPDVQRAGLKAQTLSDGTIQRDT
ncbi:MAG: tRNA (adenosine(37)-N6)-threonylcarbamoyltransferase complex ATPase subunit type 1 TsaE [Pseudomonadota bacterium]